MYFYFDPAHASRGLGTAGAIHEINYAAAHRIPYYYMGYWVRNCGSMQYKSSFRPGEMLGTDGVWRPIGRDDCAEARHKL